MKKKTIISFFLALILTFRVGIDVFHHHECEHIESVGIVNQSEHSDFECEICDLLKTNQEFNSQINLTNPLIFVLNKLNIPKIELAPMLILIGFGNKSPPIIL